MYDQIEIPGELFFALCEFFLSPPFDLMEASLLRDEICDGLRDTLEEMERPLREPISGSETEH